MPQVTWTSWACPESRVPSKSDGGQKGDRIDEFDSYLMASGAFLHHHHHEWKLLPSWFDPKVGVPFSSQGSGWVPSLSSIFQ